MRKKCCVTPIPKLPQHQWKNLEAIPVIEADESLQIIPNTEKLKQFPIYFDQNISHAIDVCVARSSVIQKLQQAANLLPDHLGIVVLDAWRSRAVQKAVQEEIGAHHKSQVSESKYV